MQAKTLFENQNISANFVRTLVYSQHTTLAWFTLISLLKDFTQNLVYTLNKLVLTRVISFVEIFDT